VEKKETGMKSSCFVFLIIFLAGCSISKPENNEYEPFTCLIHPENRVYMPEEEIVIGFNYKINPDTIDGVTAIEVSAEKELNVTVDDKKIIIKPPLPPESDLSISIDQSLKSFDNKPLMIGDEFSEKKETLDFKIETGAKLAEVVNTIPENSKSATIGVLFDSRVKIDFQEIEPQPYDLLQFDDWLVFSYESPLKKIIIKDILSVKRDEKIDEIAVELPEVKPTSGKLEYEYEANDNSVTVSIKDDSAIAAKLENLSVICPEKCSFCLNDLKPETDYDLTLTVFTTTAVKKKKISFTTEPEKPHIMISEIMHSPLGEPEKSWEFVEIYNNGTMDFDLTDCYIDDKNDSKGKDPLKPAEAQDSLIIKPGETALVTGNEAAFGDADTLWLMVDDTTVADSGLTGSETVQILCEKEGIEKIEAQADPTVVNTEKGFSVNFDSSGHSCSSEEEGGSPGDYFECM
jgi:hypothetical protein